MKGKRVCVAVSGGVDSTCALLFLKKQNYDVIALHGQFLKDSTEDYANGLERLERACGNLQVKLHIVDYSELFAKRVIAGFLESWKKGETPNPCINCNREIKFGALFNTALNDLGADFFATGHYASLVSNPWSESGHPLLAHARDASKDQSYFLGLVPPEKFGNVKFPLAQTRKAECHKILASSGIEIPIPAESQDICFINKMSCAEYVQNRSGVSQGPILLVDDIGRQPVYAGEHRGLWNYTIGQRRGLGIPYREGLYVLGKNLETNTLIIGPRRFLGMDGFFISSLNYFVPVEAWPDKVFVKYRSTMHAEEAKCTRVDKEVRLDFQNAVFPAAPGQAGVIYDIEGRILGGGIIKSLISSFIGVQGKM